MAQSEYGLDDPKKMEALYRVNPALFQTILLNQIVQNTKALKQIMEREEFQGKVDYIKQTFTAQPTWVDFHGKWKVVQVVNKGPDVFLFTTMTEELVKEILEAKARKTPQQKESRQIDVDAYDSVNLPFREDKVLGITGNAQSSSTTVKIVLIR